MYQLVASYAQPQDPPAFVEHYRNRHAVIARGLPGLRSYDWTICETSDGSRPAHFVIAVLRWDTKDEAMAALGSDVGRAAVEDLPNFAGAGVDLEFGEVEVVTP